MFQRIVILACVAFLATALHAQDWTAHIAPGYRSVNSIHPLSNGQVVAIGGNDTNDAIKTVSTSADSGTTWYYNFDAVDNPLNDGSFPSTSTGYAVGWGGLVYKTTDAGENWTQLTISGNPGTRDYNGVAFWSSSNGVIVGGNESNDAIQTILKTTDGGDSWSVISDNLDTWLRGVYAYNQSNIYACGDDGTMLKSDDAGENWSTQTLPTAVDDRRFNRLYFLTASKGFAVGGEPGTKTSIIKTTNGGDTWSTVLDQGGPMLNDIHFINSTKGYAVGDSGLVYLTEDGGDNWNVEVLTQNDSSRLRCVHFANQFYGFIAGEDGQILRYIDQNANPPQIDFGGPIKVVDLTGIEAEASFNAEGIESEVRFQYSTDSSFNTFKQTSKHLTSVSQQTNKSFVVKFLSPDSLYYGRFKISNELGDDYSEVRAFYTGFDEIPNHSFEEWQFDTVEVLDTWFSNGDVSKVQSYDGSNAIRISAESENNIGAILHGQANDSLVFSGGVPFAESPDSLVAWLNYDITAGDTAFIVCVLHNGAGNNVVDELFYLTGSTSGDFVRHAFELNYLNGNTPDSLVLGFASTSFKTEPFDTNSFMEIDNVSMIGASSSVPNGDMESWSELIDEHALHWYTQENGNGTQSTMLHRSDDSFRGNYAAEVSNIPGPNGRYARIHVGKPGWDYEPGIPLKFVHSKLIGYLKFDQQNGDTLAVSYGFFENGVSVGGAQEIFTSSMSTYERFELDLWQPSGNPDSVRIEFDIRNRAFDNNPSTSSFVVDHLSYDTEVDVDSSFNFIPEVEEKQSHLVVYPNPTNGPLCLKFNDVGSGVAQLALFDLSGKLVMSKNLSIFTGQTRLDLSSLSPQVYIAVVKAGANTFTQKVIVR